MSDPQPVINFSTSPYVHNMFEGASIPGPQATFSGDYLVHAQQWGAYAINSKSLVWSPSFGMVSPCTDKGAGFQPAAWCDCGGDFHQSARFIVATPNVPRWVVTTEPNIGAPGQCVPVGRFAAKVQVYRLGPTGLSWAGQAFIDAGGSDNRIDGDFAYIDMGNGTWTPLNLASQVPGNVVNTAPPFTPQPNIQGFNFTITRTGATSFRMERSGVSTLPCFGPKDPVTMERLAVFLVKLNEWQIAHPGQAMPLHPEQLFDDVPPGHQFYQWINQIGAAKISVGKPCAVGVLEWDRRKKEKP